MNNIVTYAEEVFETFEKMEFNSVDSLILSWISYLHLSASAAEAEGWSGIRFAELFRAECFAEIFDEIWDVPSSRRLFTALAASPRFRDIRVMGYTEQLDAVTEKQFAAVSFQLNDDLCYIAFRGTDFTLVGWKEDFNMAFQYPVPSQKEAVRYLAEAAEHCLGQLRLGGHSKGGNLAVYSAANCSKEIQDRIGRIYSHDGPGFLESVLRSKKFRVIGPRIEKTLPQSSLIGMLLEHQEAFQIVKSNRISLWQHDPFTWELEGKDFCYTDHLTPNARYLNRTLNEWLDSMSEAARERFVDALYGIFNTNDIESLEEIRSDWQKNVPAIVHAASKMDGETKGFLFQTWKELVALSLKNFPEIFKGNKEKEKGKEKEPQT